MTDQTPKNAQQTSPAPAAEPATPRVIHQHHGFEAPFNRGDTIPLAIEDVPVLAARHGLTQLQRDVAIHVFVRKTSYRATALVLQKPLASVRLAATAVANKLGYASPNVFDGSSTFATTFVHGAVPPELHALLHAMVDDFVAGADGLVHQEDARFAPMLLPEVPVELRDALRDKVAGTVARWLEQNGPATPVAKRALSWQKANVELTPEQKGRGV